MKQPQSIIMPNLWIPARITSPRPGVSRIDCLPFARRRAKRYAKPNLGAEDLPADRAARVTREFAAADLRAAVCAGVPLAVSAKQQATMIKKSARRWNHIHSRNELLTIYQYSAGGSRVKILINKDLSSYGKQIRLARKIVGTACHHDPRSHGL